MMDDICAHLVDLIANSVTAGSKKIQVIVERRRERNLLTLKMRDNGKGMDEDSVKKVTDPFFSTKSGKKVGLGISLFKGTAETCGGTFALHSIKDHGTEITASFPLNHPDLPPLGNLKETIFMVCVTNPEIEFTFEIHTDEGEFVFATREMQEILGDIPLSHPEVMRFVSNYLDEKLHIV